MAKNSIEKSLYSAPEGMPMENAMEPDVQIQIEDPEQVTITTDDMQIIIDPDADVGTGIKEFSANLAEYLGEEELIQISEDLIASFESDKASRKDWEKTYRDGLKLLGLKIEDRSEPWTGACGVFNPILSEAVVRFQADAIMETFPAQGPVKTQIIGKLTKEKEEAARRVKDDMNYQLTVKMAEYRPEHEKMLWSLALAGSAFKKVYYDPALERQISIFVPAEDFVISYGASDLKTSERYTHIMRKNANEVKKLQVAGFYRDVELSEPEEVSPDYSEIRPDMEEASVSADDRYILLEVHADLVIEGDPLKSEDDIAVPYVITIEKSSGEILSIRRNWDSEDKTYQKRMHFVHYIYIPGFGFYGYGLIHLVGGHAKSATSLLRQLVDSGTLSNLPGGLKTRGLRIKGDDTPISPGEFRDVDVPGGKISENITFLPYKEPSQTLLALMNMIVEQGRSLAAVAELKISDINKETPVGTTLALLERSLKVMSAVQARIHAAMKTEFQLLATIISESAPKNYEYTPKYNDSEGVTTREDYDIVEVIPVSDPNASTMSQRVVQYQAVLQLASSAPQMYDMAQLHRQMLETLGVRAVEKILPLDDDQKPLNPISENMNAIQLRPLKAFIYQDHEAHIKVHMNAMQDPLIQQMIGQNPNAKAIASSLQAHIAEHLAFAYRQKIEDAMGTSLPPPEEDLPKDMEVELSKVAAKASDIVLGMSKQQVAAQQAQQAQQDPVVRMQQAELQLKQADLQLKQEELKRKKTKDYMDSAAKADQIEVEKQRISTQAETEGARIGVEAAKAKDKQAADQQLAGLKIGMEIARDAVDRQQQESVDDTKPTPPEGTPDA